MNTEKLYMRVGELRLLEVQSIAMLPKEYWVSPKNRYGERLDQTQKTEIVDLQHGSQKWKVIGESVSVRPILNKENHAIVLAEHEGATLIRFTGGGDFEGTVSQRECHFEVTVLPRLNRRETGMLPMSYQATVYTFEHLCLLFSNPNWQAIEKIVGGAR